MWDSAKIFMSTQGRRGGGGVLKFMLFLLSIFFLSLKKWGITLNWNKFAQYRKI